MQQQTTNIAQTIDDIKLRITLRHPQNPNLLCVRLIRHLNQFTLTLVLHTDFETLTGQLRCSFVALCAESLLSSCALGGCLFVHGNSNLIIGRDFAEFVSADFVILVSSYRRTSRPHATAASSREPLMSVLSPARLWRISSSSSSPMADRMADWACYFDTFFVNGFVYIAYCRVHGEVSFNDN